MWFPALEYFLSENKRKEPDHVFLRWQSDNGILANSIYWLLFLDLVESEKMKEKIEKICKKRNKWPTNFLM